jgi:hypothetical protein
VANIGDNVAVIMNEYHVILRCRLQHSQLYRGHIAEAQRCLAHATEALQRSLMPVLLRATSLSLKRLAVMVMVMMMM